MPNCTQLIQKYVILRLQVVLRHQIILIIIMSLQKEKGYVPLNVFSHRPCFTQVVSYLVILLQNICFWALIQPHFQSQTTRFTIIALYAVSLVILLIVGFITSYMDPTDPIVREYNSGNESIARTHISNCLYCDHCSSYVLNTSRHCKKCDRQWYSYQRCIHYFDHHCIWINNCVGKNNYAFFIAMIYSALGHLFFYFLSMVLLSVEVNWADFIGEMVVNWIVGVISGIFMILIVGLIVLHMYLISKEMTTFQYIMLKKTLDEQKKINQLPKFQEIRAKSAQKPSSEQLTIKKSAIKKKQDDLYPPHSAFFDITRPQQLQKSQHTYNETLQKSKNQSKSKMTEFEMLQIAVKESDFAQYEQQQFHKVYRHSRSLKFLVGDSVGIKSKKSKFSETSSKNDNTTRKQMQPRQPQENIVHYVNEERQVKQNPDNAIRQTQ